jgi:ABC-type polysaccharide/polyol phosphate export permease
VVRDLSVRYRRSTLGLLWTMLLPLLNMLVLRTVFSNAFGVEIENYAVYALSGILFWNFFHQGAVASMNSLRGNASIIQKLPVPTAVFPVAAVLAGAINLGLALVPLLLILVVTGHPLGPSLLFLPASISVAALLTLGVGLLLSPLAVFFTDVVELTGVFLTLLMYLTPIFYPVSIVPPRFRWVVTYNPVRLVLEVFRGPIYLGAVPAAGQVAGALLVALLALWIGAATFRRSSDRIPFYI